MVLESEALIDRLSRKPKSIEDCLQKKEERLPKGIRAYIRRLKETGDWDKAVGFREDSLRKRALDRQGRAKRELNKTIVNLLQSDDPIEQGKDEVKAVWLMYAAGILQSDQKVSDILEILDSKAENLKRELEENLPAIRDEIRILLS